MGHPVHCRVSNSIPDLCPQDASSIPFTLLGQSKNVSRHCCMSRWGGGGGCKVAPGQEPTGLKSPLTPALLSDHSRVFT